MHKTFLIGRRRGNQNQSKGGKGLGANISFICEMAYFGWLTADFKTSKICP
jgi:hypothetical protein